MRWFAIWLYLYYYALVATTAHQPAYEQQEPIRINSGGSSFIDAQGILWQADQYYTFGASNTNQEEGRRRVVCQTQRRGSLAYDIPVAAAAAGWYLVRCHFATTTLVTDNQSLFSVKIQNEIVHVNATQESLKSRMVQVTNGTLHVELVQTSVHAEPAICGIEVIPTTSHVYIDSGSTETWIDSQQRTWQADAYYNTGLVWSGVLGGRDIIIVGTTPDLDILYQTERYDIPHAPPLVYNIPVSAPGMYFVVLHFSENCRANRHVGKRVFGIQIQGETVVHDLDIYAETGAGFTALEKNFMVQVAENDNSIRIQFIEKTEKPTIAGLEVHGIRYYSSLLEEAPPLSAEQSNLKSLKAQVENENFDPLYINVGSKESVYDGVHAWSPDVYFAGGQPSSTTGRTIMGTPFGEVYKTSRFGIAFEYEITAPTGYYQITLHFAETSMQYQQESSRLFYVYVEGILILDSLDIYKTVGGYASYVVNVPTFVRDGAISIEFVSINGPATVSAIEVKAKTSSETSIGEFEPHYAHSVPGGPYFKVDADNDGKETVMVDGSFSHTHLPGARLVRWKWMLSDDGSEIGTNNQKTSLELPIGNHDVTLEVTDSGGYTNEYYTTVTVRAFGYPNIEWILPNEGDVNGGDTLTIGGSGFTYTAQELIVYIGSTELTGNDLIVQEGKVKVKSMPSGSVGMVDVSVKTPIGTSTSVPYTFVDDALPPIKFTSGFVDSDIRSPTCLAFGPDGRLYIGTQLGRIARLTLDGNYQIIDKFVSNAVADSAQEQRTILGIAFDPSEGNTDNPTVYVSHSFLFHGKLKSYNGIVSAVGGPNLDLLRHVVTGLPISDHDHGVNGLVFGNFGELYVQVPGNTNAGVPGSLSTTRQQEETLFSCATIVARNVNNPDFDGHLEFDDDDNQIGGWDVSVFAPGQRNSYGIVLHSNGYLYATDNGANVGYGMSSVTCEQNGPSPHEPDELNIVMEGHYYGHANRRRGRDDYRQCIWRTQNETSDESYTAPIGVLPASSDGLCEFETDHFAGQLRGNLIIGRWKGELYNVKLTNNGLATEKGLSDYPPVLIEEGALDIVQGPDGTLFTAAHSINAIKFYAPDEEEARSEILNIKSVFPRRGPEQGGTTLTIYGDNLYLGGFPSVTVGGKPCAVQNPSDDSTITCTLPQGNPGSADIVVTSGLKSNVFHNGYRFVPAQTESTMDSHTNDALAIASPSPKQTHAPVSFQREERSSTSSTSDSLGIQALKWINTDTLDDIGPVEQGMCTFCADLSLTIRADTWGDVNSVRLTLDGPISFRAIENNMPYTLFGDGRWDYQGMYFQKGSYTITAQTFSKPDGHGLGGRIISFDFEII